MVTVDWTNFKAFISAKTITPSYALDENEEYQAWVSDAGVTIQCQTLVSGSTEYTDFNDNYKSLWNQPNIVDTVLKTTTASPVWISSHSLGCRRTWWQHSVKLTGQGLSIVTANSRVVDGITYDKYGITGNTTDVIIDLTSGLLLNEDDIAGTSRSVSPVNHSGVIEWGGSATFVPVVYSDAVVYADYKVFADEMGIFIPVSENGKTITADLHRSGTPNFDYIPSAGKALKLGLTEVNALNVDLDSEVVFFEVFVGEDTVARRIYKSEADYVAASIGAPVKYDDWVFMQWDYRQSEPQGMDAMITIKDSTSMKVTLRTESGNPLTKKDPAGPNPKLIITLHCTSVTE